MGANSMPQLRAVKTNDQPVFEGFLTAHRWHDRDKRDDISSFMSVNTDPNTAAEVSREKVPGAPHDCFLIRVTGDDPTQNGYVSCHRFYDDKDVRDQQSCWLNVFDDQKRAALFKAHETGDNRFILEIVGGYADQPVENGFVACHQWYTDGPGPGGSGPDMRDDQSCYLHNNKDRNCATEFEIGSMGGGLPGLRAIKTNDQPVFEGFMTAHRWHDRDKRDDISSFMSVNTDPGTAAECAKEHIPGCPKHTFIIRVSGPEPTQNGWVSCHRFYEDKDVRDQQSCWLNVFDDKERAALFKAHETGHHRFVLEIVGGYKDQPVQNGFVPCHQWYTDGPGPGGSGPDLRDDQSCYLHNNADRNCATEFEISDSPPVWRN